MVDVPVDDRHPLALVGQFRRGDRDVVEQAEAHRPVGNGVVSGWATSGERHVTRPRRERVDRIEHGARGTATGVPRSRRRERVGIEITATSLTEPLEL